jgi:PAS domain S-box-containing protein
MIADPIDNKSPSESLNSLRFSEIFNLEELQRMQDLLSDSTGISSVIKLTDGTPVTRPSIFQPQHHEMAPFPETWSNAATIELDGKPVASWLISYEKNGETDEQNTLHLNKAAQLLSAYSNEISSKANNHLKQLQRIDEIEKKNALLKENEEKLKALFETMPNGFYRSTPDGYYVDANLAMVKMLGYDSKEELLKVYIPTDIYVSPAERDDFNRSNEDFISDFEVYRLKTKDGRIIWLEDNARYIRDENGKLIYNEGICRDITDRLRSEAEIKLQNEQLIKLNAEKDKFFSIIAHDLRSPFNSFLGLTKIMAEELPSLTMAEIQMFAVSMEKSAANLFRLLENLLQWARMQQGLIPINQEVVSLLPVVDESIEMMLEQAKTKNIAIKNDIPDDLKVFADSNILQTVIRNLVSNAVKFTLKGGNITLSANETGNNCIEISIRDSGIGMDHAIMDNLFRLDVQTSRKGTDGEPSSGLGLILCKDFIEKHGGNLRVESEEGKGSTFYFTIPY